jgi:two-component system, OmpR family, response regulator ArlR
VSQPEAEQGTKMKILIVEDEVRLCEALAEILKKNKYIVDAVHDGESGLDYGLSGVYDAIILDIMLPKMDGVTVLRQLRANRINTPVIMLTARYMTGDKVDGLDAGADDYLTKPFETEELLARLRALTRRKGEIQSQQLTVGDLTLNTHTLELSCGAKTIPLSLKEFQMLEILFRNSDRIITKELLIDKVWGFDSEAVHNNVEVYVSFLRKKIKHLDSKVEIQTNRGIGYRIKP